MAGPLAVAHFVSQLKKPVSRSPRCKVAVQCKDFFRVLRMNIILRYILEVYDLIAIWLLG